MNQKIQAVLYSKTQKKWIHDFKKISDKIDKIEFCVTTEIQKENELIFIHEEEAQCMDFIRVHKKNNRVFFLISENENKIPKSLQDELVEDVLIYPFRTVEVLGKLKSYQQHLMWRELYQLNERLNAIIETFREDVDLATRLQKQFAPKKFVPLKIMTPYYRYFAGIKPGGNYFDLLPSTQESSYSLLLSDSSSYGLSSHVLSMVLNIAVKINAGEFLTPQKTAELIFKDVLSTLKEKDRLSLFFGSLSRFNLELQYVNFGDNLFLHSSKDKEFKVIPHTAPALSVQSFLPLPKAQTLKLNPQDRFFILSRGLCEELGGEHKICEFLSDHKEKKSEDLLNDLGVELRASLKKNKKDFPDRDCTLSFFELNEKLTQLRKIENVG